MTRGPAIAVAAAASVGAGLIHLALAPEHLQELGALGWGFYLAAALQLGWVVGVLAVIATQREAATRASAIRGMTIAGIVMNGAILGAWVVSRTVGLPAGETPWVPEPIGRADLISAALEIGIVAMLAVQWRAPAAHRPARERGRPAPLRLAAALTIAVIAAGTGVGLAPDDAHAAGHEASSSEHAPMLEGVAQPAP